MRNRARCSRPISTPTAASANCPSTRPPSCRSSSTYLLQFFSTGVIYTEKEVNTILRRYNEDVAGLRRDLIDRGMLERKSDGSQYWRPAPTNPADEKQGVQHVP
jgi:hypothetical protein